jgi:protein gp37
MGDLFHRLVPDDFLHALWAEMVQYPHIYMLLTKRADRTATWAGPWPNHVWMGVTCGHPMSTWRINALRACKAKVKFISCEPLLGSLLPIDLTGIDMVIVGGESGKGYRPMKMKWAWELWEECNRRGVAYFFKQDSGYKEGQRPWLVAPDGRCWRIQQFLGELTPPVLVDPEAEKEDEPPFRVIA